MHFKTTLNQEIKAEAYRNDNSVGMHFVALSRGLTQEGKGCGAAEADKGEKNRAESNAGCEQVTVVVVIHQAETLGHQQHHTKHCPVRGAAIQFKILLSNLLTLSYLLL